VLVVLRAASGEENGQVRGNWLGFGRVFFFLRNFGFLAGFFFGRGFLLKR